MADVLGAQGAQTMLHALTLTEQGMSAVQEIMSVLRDADREIMTLVQRVRQLEQHACCDDLTGLPNRRGLEHQMNREEARALRYGSGAAVVLVDVEDLHALMGRLGNGAGEALLHAVAGALHTGARGSDVVARYDEDTFAALLPGADTAGARAFLDRVRSIARFARLPTDEVVPILLSSGIATRDEAGSLPVAVELAEQRLLLSKQGEPT